MAVSTIDCPQFARDNLISKYPRIANGVTLAIGMPELLFKEANSLGELQQIHALNHLVFAAEIGQHPTNSTGLLVDSLHHQNRYFVAARSSVIVGMISANDGPDFSITKRLRDRRVLDSFKRPIEIRLLAIARSERQRTIIAGLLWLVYRFAVSNGFSDLLISAIAEREPMYRKLGFHPLGPGVPEGAATFIPMARPVLHKDKNLEMRASLYEKRWLRSLEANRRLG